MGGRELLPVGDSVWSNTLLSWPGAKTGQQFRERFTDAILTVKLIDDQPSLLVSEVLSALPVALLESLV